LPDVLNRFNDQIKKLRPAPMPAPMPAPVAPRQVDIEQPTESVIDENYYQFLKGLKQNEILEFAESKDYKKLVGDMSKKLAADKLILETKIEMAKNKNESIPSMIEKTDVLSEDANRFSQIQPGKAQPARKSFLSGLSRFFKKTGGNSKMYRHTAKKTKKHRNTKKTKKTRITKKTKKTRITKKHRITKKRRS